MNEIYSIQPFLGVLISASAVLFIITAKRPNIREGWPFLFAIINFAVIASMLPAILAGNEITFTVARVLPGVAIAFRVDAMGLLFGLVSSSLWIVTSAYSIGYMRTLSEHAQTRYYCFFALSLSAAAGVAFAGNLFTMYLFYEMLSFATYPLVTHHQDDEAKKSGRKYLGYIVGTSVGLVLPAMIFIYAGTGTLDFAPGGILSWAGFKPLLICGLVLMFVFGFAKAGIMPFHSWLPAAMVAPTPVSALLHAVAVVKVGAFCIFRTLTHIFGVDLLGSTGLDFLGLHSINMGTVVAVIASFTILTASLIALSQDGLKRRLAFSTIGQLSYIILGAALLSPKGITGGLLHIGMHAFGKITLFFCAGAIFVTTGVKNISDMTGIGRRMPWTMGAFFVGSLSVIGLPPCGGFISKWFLLVGTLESGQLAFMAVLLSSSLLNAAYFLPIVYRAFFCTEEESKFEKKIDEAPSWCLGPLLFTALVSIALFIYPHIFLTLAQMAAKTITGGG